MISLKLIKHRIKAKLHMGTLYIGLIAIAAGMKLVQ
jgi:hypothetical protein